MAFEVNKYQTALTDEVLENMSQEAREILLDAINNVVFIRNLISPNRKYAKDLQRDVDGKIIVDLCNPHILENMDYFRPTGNHYRQHGTLTNLRPNANPNSEFGQWIREEINRIWYGMVRPEDGEWIPGDMYFYLNYTPILQSKVRKGTRQADRIVDFPEIWEASYLWFHYVDQARNGGLYNDFTGGQHCVHIARRGVGKSFTSAAMLAKLFIVGENVHAKKSVRGLVTAYQKEYLTKDGILNKFIDVIDFCADNTQFPSKRLKASIQEMAWKMGYLDAVTGVAKGTGNEVIGVSSKDDSDKIRGKRANKIIFEEFGAFMNFIDVWNTTIPSVQEGDIAFGQLIAQGCVCENTKVYKANGEPVLIQDLKKEDGILGFKDGKVSVENITHMNIPTFKPCVRITTTSGRILECSTDHPILVRKLRSPRKKHDKTKRDLCFDYSFEPAINLLNRKENYIMVSQTLDIFGQDTLFDARLVGMLIGDGSYGISTRYKRNNIIEYKTPVFSNADSELLNYVTDKYKCSINKHFKTKDGRNYYEYRISNIIKYLKDINIAGQSKQYKTLPSNFRQLNRENLSDLLGGLFDTDGSVCYYPNSSNKISITASSSLLLSQIQEVLLKFGVHSKIYNVKPRIAENRKDKKECYSLYIQGKVNIINFHKNIHFKVKAKQQKLEEMVASLKINHVMGNLEGAFPERVKSVEFIGMKKIYNLTAGVSHTYLANDIITHNTGGTRGSDFSGALEIIYNPKGYGVYGLPNVFDRNTQGKTFTVFFTGGYMNRKGYYNEDGVSDVIGALMSIIQDYLTVKYNSSDPIALTQRKAEIPITIQDSIMKVESTIYPIADLTDVINELDLNSKSFDDVYVGELGLKDGQIEFKPTLEFKPVRDFPHKDNKIPGAVEIFKMPEYDRSGKIYSNRYIAGIDVFDDDASNTMSLGAIKVLDLMTDKIVAQYTGRRMFADEFYEICRRLLLYYNARANYENNKKGLFAYFSKMNCTYLLTDTLEFLKDKDMVKGELYGNKIKGSPSTAPIKSYYRKCIRDWLLKPVVIVETVDDQMVETSVPQLKFLKTRSLLKELTLWNPDGNFDEHDALGMLMLLREDRLRLMGDKSYEDVSSGDKDYLGNDPFFSKNYDERKKKIEAMLNPHSSKFNDFG